MIKFFDIYRQVRKFFKKNINDLIKIIKYSRFINGQSVKLFESKFSKFCDVKYATGCKTLLIYPTSKYHICYN